MIDQARLKELLDYNPETGAFTWRSSCGCSSPGSLAGTLSVKGYIRIKIGRVLQYAHRLAWLYVYGVHPPDFLDHINRVRDDNRICNLRIASFSENAQNCSIPRSNRSGVLGVSWHKASNMWTAQISISGKKIYLGVYKTIEEAKAARAEAKRKYHAFSPVDAC